MPPDLNMQDEISEAAFDLMKCDVCQLLMKCASQEKA